MTTAERPHISLQRLQISTNARTAVVDGRVVVLDLKSDSYEVMNPTASAMWSALSASRDRAEILSSLGGHFSVSPDRLEGDFDAFLAKCCKDGLLTTSLTPPRPALVPPIVHACRPRFLTFRAWLHLFSESRLLATHGAARSCARLAGLSRVERTPQPEALLARAVRAFSLAENFFHLRRAPQDCLPRSLALFAFLRSLGLPVEHVIGVCLFPFTAHAWVEHRGRVVHDDPSNQQTFTTLARIAS